VIRLLPPSRLIPLAAGLALCALVGRFEARAQDLPAFAAPVREGWELTFSEEFSAKTIDPKRWNLKDPWGAEKNAELQAYVPGALTLKNGRLRIEADRRKAFYDQKVRDYVSGMATTARKFSQRYGLFEVRCRIPKGRGLWPAFWMLPDPPSWPPEIDVFEILGHEANRVYLTHHWPDPAKPKSASLSNMGEWVAAEDYSDSFHTFGVEWDRGQIRWLVDDVERHRATEKVPDVPMFLLLNLAVGGQWPGAPDDTTVFPAVFEIDWVRVWKRK
jgi:beta-glucanase (GH16 family)